MELQTVFLYSNPICGVGTFELSLFLFVIIFLSLFSIKTSEIFLFKLVVRSILTLMISLSYSNLLNLLLKLTKLCISNLNRDM